MILSPILLSLSILSALTWVIVNRLHILFQFLWRSAHLIVVFGEVASFLYVELMQSLFVTRLTMLISWITFSVVNSIMLIPTELTERIYQSHITLLENNLSNPAARLSKDLQE